MLVIGRSITTCVRLGLARTAPVVWERLCESSLQGPFRHGPSQGLACGQDEGITPCCEGLAAPCSCIACAPTGTRAREAPPELVRCVLDVYRAHGCSVSTEACAERLIITLPPMALEGATVGDGRQVMSGAIHPYKKERS